MISHELWQYVGRRGSGRTVPYSAGSLLRMVACKRWNFPKRRSSSAGKRGLFERSEFYAFSGCLDWNGILVKFPVLHEYMRKNCRTVRDCPAAATPADVLSAPMAKRNDITG